ncbi:hypothetical protein Q8F55_001652 [Vanrija albida]|uniref:DUF1996 domain-containing protein n=1 Tax=Vanrija albida TaxID=181172 RepID=A0ABR3Q7J2_9TREE
MISAALLSTVALAYASSAKAADGSFVTDSGVLTISRIDPITSGGNPSAHVSQALGSSNFRNFLNFPTEQGSAQCTTNKATADQSNYYSPILYFINQAAGGQPETYTPLTASNRITYHYKDDGKKTYAYPRGLRVISGNPDQRETSARTAGVTIDTNPAAGADYITATTWFPNCGLATQALDSADHFSHLAWPVEGAGGATCPSSHPVRYPAINWEARFYLSADQKAKWNSAGPNIILSNGDVTGQTWHASFVAGWKEQVLQNALDNCKADIGEDLAQCSYLAVNAAKNDCRLQGQIPSEDVGFNKPLTALKGFNPRWEAGPKPSGSAPIPGWVSPFLQLSVRQGQAGAVTIPVAFPGLPNAITTSQLATIATTSAGSKIVKWARKQDGSIYLPVIVGNQQDTNDNVLQNGENNVYYAAGISNQEPFNSVLIPATPTNLRRGFPGRA